MRNEHVHCIGVGPEGHEAGLHRDRGEPLGGRGQPVVRGVAWARTQRSIRTYMRKFSCSSPTSRDMSRHRPGRGLGNISKLELTMFVDICLDLEGSSPLSLVSAMARLHSALPDMEVSGVVNTANTQY